jgi:hypothetical protein
MGKINRYLQLPFTRQRLLVESTLILMVVRIGLRLMSFKSLHQFIQKIERRARESERADDTYQDDISWAIKRAGENLIGKNTCLPVALAGQLQLNLHGYPARTHLGVQKTLSGGIKAHAWVECCGKVVIGGPEQEIDQYTLLSEIEGPRA